MAAERAKVYSNYKYALEIIDTVFLLAALFIFVLSGLSKILELRLAGIIPVKALIIPAYLLSACVIYYALSFPVTYYRSYILEHKFSLSKQNLRGWFIDQIKSGIIAYLIGLILISAFYYVLRQFPSLWWLAISAFWILFSVIMAKLAPLIIIPLFFKCKKLSDEELRMRIINLAGKMKVNILDVFEIDFSKKTVKANAALTGWGKTRRVILADTLKDKYGADEIEVILAHEFAHHKLNHIAKLIAMNSIFVIASFYLIFKTSPPALAALGLSSLSDLASLPLVLTYFVLFGIVMQPFEAFVSRRFERNADLLALKTTGLKGAFVSMMEKLASQNLADRNPNPVIKFFFFDHPPIDERISLAAKV